MGAQHGGQRGDLGRGENPRQRAGPPRRRHALPRTRALWWAGPVAPDWRPRRRGLGGRRRTRRSSTTAWPPCWSPPPPIPGIVHGLQELVTGSAGALGGDEPEHVNRLDVRRRLRDHGEEHPQVVGRSQHRVRTAPALKELQIIVDQRHAAPQDQLSAGDLGSGSGRDRGRTFRGPQLHRRAATAAGRNVPKDHVHNKHERTFVVLVTPDSGSVLLGYHPEARRAGFGASALRRYVRAPPRPHLRTRADGHIRRG